MTYLLCDCQLITCNHLNTNSKVKCPAEGHSTIMSWRIKQGKQPTKCPRTSRTFFSLFWNLLICNPKRLQTLFSELVNNGMDFSSNFFSWQIFIICSRAPLLARIQLVIAVRLSMGLKGKKCISMMFVHASFSN